ncbi:uncharacterized protein ARMOST_20587 [Armillaria ostoyae]|uniref:Uncharacterized protein n=1 Tax=Armillaria ostoyae TaxID=47428 RepID=A0A284S7W5_ARMOS|nr:uncharacterized protein ARMOST_20587 [Armillaria ostoyae]
MITQRYHTKKGLLTALEMHGSRPGNQWDDAITDLKASSYSSTAGGSLVSLAHTAIFKLKPLRLEPPPKGSSHGYLLISSMESPVAHRAYNHSRSSARPTVSLRSE